MLCLVLLMSLSSSVFREVSMPAGGRASGQAGGRASRRECTRFKVDRSGEGLPGSLADLGDEETLRVSRKQLREAN